jgi:hypothetical protein
MFVGVLKDGLVMTVVRLIVEVAARMEALASERILANAQVGIIQVSYI